MGRHNAADGHAEPAAQAVTLYRVARTLDSLGMDFLEGNDRIVVPFPTHTCTIWIDDTKPRRLVVDSQLRVPVDFMAGGDLGCFINTWNQDHLAGTASYRLEDSGDYSVRMRAVAFIRCGLTHDQLSGELENFFDHAAHFTTQASSRFHDISFDAPLPPALLRLLDNQLLAGRHPQGRHLPAGMSESRQGLTDDFPVPDDHPVEDVVIDDLSESLLHLGFVATPPHDGIITARVNGISFGVCIDGGTYARVTAVWDSGRETDSSWTALAAVCNDVNEARRGTSVWVADDDGDAHVYAEACCRVADGLTVDQLNQFVVAALASLLSVLDDISVQFSGRSAVDWPGV